MVMCNPRRTVPISYLDLGGLFQVSTGIPIDEFCLVQAARAQATDVVIRFKSSVVTTIVEYYCDFQVFHRMCNEMCLSSEVPFDRSSLHSWFLH